MLTQESVRAWSEFDGVLLTRQTLFELITARRQLIPLLFPTLRYWIVPYIVPKRRHRTPVLQRSLHACLQPLCASRLPNRAEQQHILLARRPDPRLRPPRRRPLALRQRLLLAHGMRRQLRANVLHQLGVLGQDLELQAL